MQSEKFWQLEKWESTCLPLWIPSNRKVTVNAEFEFRVVTLKFIQHIGSLETSFACRTDHLRKLFLYL